MLKTVALLHITILCKLCYFLSGFVNEHSNEKHLFEIKIICNFIKVFIFTFGEFNASFVRVLSLRSSVIHGFVTEPWHSLHVLFLCECAASSVLEPRALLSACLVLCWSVVFGSRHSCLEFRFRVGVRTLALHVLSHCVSVRLEFARPRALLSTCVVCVWCCTQSVFLSAACIHVMSCAVWHAAHVFHWLRAFMLSCLVWTRGLWVFSLAACSCPVLHMAGNLFCWPCACLSFVWAHGFCLSFLCAMCSHVNCLDPTHLVTWLLVNLPHLCFPHYPPHLLPL